MQHTRVAFANNLYTDRILYQNFMGTVTNNLQSIHTKIIKSRPNTTLYRVIKPQEKRREGKEANKNKYKSVHKMVMSLD